MNWNNITRLDEITWKKIFISVFKSICKETKLIYRIVVTKKELHRFNKLTSVFHAVSPVIDHEFRHNIVKVAADYFDNVMAKFIVNNRTVASKTDTNLLFTITNCEIVRYGSLTHRINYKLMCLSLFGIISGPYEKGILKKFNYTILFMKYHIYTGKMHNQAIFLSVFVDKALS